MTFRRFAVVVLAFSLPAAACSGGTTEPAAPATSEGPPETLAFADPTLPPAGRAGGSLVLGAGPLTSFDPARANVDSPTSLALLDLLFDGLTALDDANEPIAALADEWTTTDNTSWTFVLADAEFADGEPVEATDVQYSLERLIALPNRPVGAPLAVIDSITAGDGEVTIDLTRPFAGLPSLLAAPAFGILPDGSNGEISSGPFEVADETDEVVSLRRTDRFSGNIDGIDVLRYADEDEAFEAYLAGEVDWAVVPAGRSEELTGELGRVHRTPLDATVFYGLNVAHPDLRNIALRQAIVLAIDSESIVAEQFADVGSVLWGIVPPGVPGARTDACDFRCGLAAADATGFLAEVEASGDLPTIGIDYLVDDRVELDLARAIAADLDAIGLETELRPGTLDELGERILAGEHMLFRYGWIGRYSSSESWLGDAFASDGTDNVTAVNSDVVDAALDDAREATRPTDAMTAYADAETAVLDEYAVVPLLALDRVVAVNVRVHDYTQRANGTFDAASVWLD
ncbi:MAG: ABC transporter substrate-binding protein [Acidimicrobiales bacterium]|nr:ABC transporter substrate-binding protein [Acidimicrobiales bacterium]